MKMPKVKNFLGCMRLETGGLVIGWLSAIGNVLGFTVGVGLIIFSSIIDCDDLSRAMKSDEELEDSEINDYKSYLCSFGLAIIITIAMILVILSIGFFIIAYFCISGTHRRNHIYVKPMMVLLGIGTVLSFLQLFTMNYESIGPGLVKTLIGGYEFIVIYSLHNVFQEEYERRHAGQYQPTLQKV